jgi:hypothetical protein
MAYRNIDTKEAAVLLRAELKRRWPGVKFSVRFECYSMGSHITVRWNDGPAERHVDEMAAAYSGSRFESMDDSHYYVHSWLFPDGRAVQLDKDEPPPEGAEEVSFSGSQPSCHRTISPELRERGEKAWAGLSVHEHCALLNNYHFPRWDGETEGYKLAWFLDAAQLTA